MRRFPVALFVPIFVGAGIMLKAGAPSQRWALHLASGALGAIVYLGVRRASARSWAPRSRLWPAAVLSMLALMALALFGEGLLGVHRWIRLGPFLLHPSALFCPALLVIGWRLWPSYPRAVLFLLCAIAAIHLAAPDAGQATAFGASALVLLVGRLVSPREKDARLFGAAVATMIAIVVSVVLAWIRPDPLAPAPFVEDILERARGISFLGFLAGAVSLLVLVLSPIFVNERPFVAAPEGASRWDERVIVVYLAGTVMVSLVAPFPVPLLGLGPSPVIGAFLGLALLSSERGSRDH